MNAGPRVTRSTGVAAVVLAAALLAFGCGDDDGISAFGADDDAGSTALDSTDGESTEADSTDASAYPSDACPLTAEVVSEALGEPVELSYGCVFAPGGVGTPYAAFFPNGTVLGGCEKNRELGFDEEIEGLGADAYVLGDKLLGTSILVCGTRVFQITVHTPGDDNRALAAARQLAEFVLAES